MIKSVGAKTINFIGGTLILLLIFSCSSKKEKVLPILGNYDVIYKTVDGKEVTDTIFPKIPKFYYQDENGKEVTNKNFKNRVWIVEFFFARCPSICPIMNSQLKRFYKETKEVTSELQFLSFTIDPKNDTPEALLAYRKKNNITAKNWSFLRGNEAETHRMGIENFQTFAGRDAEAEGGFAHSGAFTLVDKSGYVRGVYAVTNYDGTVNEKEYQRMKAELFKLLEYEYDVVIP